MSATVESKAESAGVVEAYEITVSRDGVWPLPWHWRARVSVSRGSDWNLTSRLEFLVGYALTKDRAIKRARAAVDSFTVVA